MNNLVTLPTAKLAKKAGFNIPTPLKFHTEKFEGEEILKQEIFIWGGVQNWNSQEPHMDKWRKDNNYLKTWSRPTHEMLFRWLKDRGIDFTRFPKTESKEERLKIGLKLLIK